MEMNSLMPHPVIKEIYGHGLYEYMLVAHPDDLVQEKVMTEKRSFYAEYKNPAPVENSPHIMVSVFFAKEAMEDTLTRWIQRICRQQQSFTVTLNNYSGFPPHTIYLRIQNENPFQKLTTDLKALNHYISSCACPPMQFISKPYVNIAGKLPEDIYSRALKQYSHKTFHESFVVNELQLLKRKHEYDVCKSVNVFGLQPEENSCVV